MERKRSRERTSKRWIDQAKLFTGMSWKKQYWLQRTERNGAALSRTSQKQVTYFVFGRTGPKKRPRTFFPIFSSQTMEFIGFLLSYTYSEDNLAAARTTENEPANIQCRIPSYLSPPAKQGIFIQLYLSSAHLKFFVRKTPLPLSLKRRLTRPRKKRPPSFYC